VCTSTWGDSSITILLSNQGHRLGQGRGGQQGFTRKRSVTSKSQERYTAAVALVPYHRPATVRKAITSLIVRASVPRNKVKLARHRSRCQRRIAKAAVLYDGDPDNND
jgi:hypothetical protein